MSNHLLDVLEPSVVLQVNRYAGSAASWTDCGPWFKHKKGGALREPWFTTGKEVETPWARPGKPEGQWLQTLGFPH